MRGKEKKKSCTDLEVTFFPATKARTWDFVLCFASSKRVQGARERARACVHVYVRVVIPLIVDATSLHFSVYTKRYQPG